MEYTENINKALSIIKQCSSTKEDVRLFNSLSYIGLDVEKSVPLLNELYNSDVEISNVEKIKNVKEFLGNWEMSLKPSTFERITSDSSIAWYKKIWIVVWLIYVLVMLLNNYTDFNNTYTQQSEGYLSKALQGFSTVDTVLSPEDWMFSGLQWALGDALYANLFLIIVLGLISLVGTFFLFDKDNRKYIHQPISAILILAIAIVEGSIFGEPKFNYIWTGIVPFTYIVLTVFGVLFVWWTMKLFKANNPIMIGIIQAFPFVVWFLLYKFTKSFV